ncbi:hypothetical protein PIB30_014722 [Stylosanthes scabra]|uniref:PB1-like domain-containing protein n=1 Tax=Stylosanthes scabra TaxID=79078 RepID=A0ABU6W6W8_9FABA|nr:hypothetical protein [Stylosanthes scabra]
MATFVVPVLNVGGKLGSDENGVLKYIDGQVQTFDAVDVDMICIPDLEGMTKSLGYPKYTAMHWLHPTAANMEFGPREIKTNSDVNQLRISLVENGCVNFQIYFEHPVSDPVIVEGFEAVPGGDGCVNLDSDGEGGSSSHDSYESTEDEAYKPPPDGYESSSDTDDGKSKKVNKRGTRTKKIMTPTKKESPKKNVRSTPTRRSSRTPSLPPNSGSITLCSSSLNLLDIKIAFLQESVSSIFSSTISSSHENLKKLKNENQHMHYIVVRATKKKSIRIKLCAGLKYDSIAPTVTSWRRKLLLPGLTHTVAGSRARPVIAADSVFSKGVTPCL